jgi:hypothetical protein
MRLAWMDLQVRADMCAQRARLQNNHFDRMGHNYPRAKLLSKIGTRFRIRCGGSCFSD